MPDRPSDLQLAPWEAVLAQALQQDEPERTALEVIQAAQDFTTHTGHLFQLRQAFWQLDVVPKIDEMVRQRIPAAEYERYLKDPERPAFLQALREHEIGGRRIEDVLDSITAEPLDGLRSIAAGLHGRAGKEPPPVRGATKTWAERTPAARVSRDPGSRPDGGPAAGRTRPPARRAARRSGRSRHGAFPRAPGAGGAAGRLGEAGRASSATYRELAGITDPAQAIGPVAVRAARPGRDVPRVRAGSPAARRGGLAEGDGPGRARGRRGRARPGHGPGPGRRPGRDRPAGGRVGRRPGPRSHRRRRQGRRGAGRGRGARPRTPPRTWPGSP